jgi:Family of unknown function (DUF6152)
MVKLTKPAAIAIFFAALSMTPVPVGAHHSMIAQFATEKPVTLKGTITGLLWRNPHAAIFLDVVGAEGQVERWRVETGSTPRMMRRGLNKSDIRPGREVIIGGYAARDGQSKLAGLVITFLDREAAGEEASFALGR